MRPSDQDEPRPGLAAFVAASIARTLRYAAAYDEQVMIHRELVAEAGRLAAAIEAHLTPRRPAAPEVDAPS